MCMYILIHRSVQTLAAMLLPVSWSMELIVSLEIVVITASFVPMGPPVGHPHKSVI